MGRLGRIRAAVVAAAVVTGVMAGGAGYIAYEMTNPEETSAEAKAPEEEPEGDGITIIGEEEPAKPTAETEKQQAQTETQAPQTEKPQAQTETPAPQTETQAPQAETAAPQTETPAPQTETPAPQTETQAPQTETQAPQTEEPAIQIDTQAPEPEDNLEEPIMIVPVTPETEAKQRTAVTSFFADGTAVAPDAYIRTDMGQRFLHQEDLNGMTAKGLYFLWYEQLAKVGYVPQDTELQEYFTAQSWFSASDGMTEEQALEAVRSGDKCTAYNMDRVGLAMEARPYK